jgi:hypothetical protein
MRNNDFDGDLIEVPVSGDKARLSWLDESPITNGFSDVLSQLAHSMSAGHVPHMIRTNPNGWDTAGLTVSPPASIKTFTSFQPNKIVLSSYYGSFGNRMPPEIKSTDTNPYRVKAENEAEKQSIDALNTSHNNIGRLSPRLVEPDFNGVDSYNDLKQRLVTSGDILTPENILALLKNFRELTELGISDDLLEYLINKINITKIVVDNHWLLITEDGELVTPPYKNIRFSCGKITKSYKPLFKLISSNKYYTYGQHRVLASAICSGRLDIVERLLRYSKCVINVSYFSHIIRQHSSEKLYDLVQKYSFGDLDIRNMTIRYNMLSWSHRDPSIKSILASPYPRYRFDKLLHLILSDKKYGYLIEAVNKLYLSNNDWELSFGRYDYGKLCNIDKLVFGGILVAQCIDDNMLYSIDPTFDTTKCDINLDMALDSLGYESDRNEVLDFIAKYNLKGDIRVSEPIGSRFSCTVYAKDIDLVKCGCFTGTLNEFKDAVTYRHADVDGIGNQYYDKYMEFIEQCN